MLQRYQISHQHVLFQHVLFQHDKVQSFCVLIIYKYIYTYTYTTLKYHDRRYQQGTNTLGLSSVYQNANTKCNNLKKIAITFFQQCINHTMMYICIYTTNILVLIVYFGLYNKFPYFHSNMKRIEQYAASKNRLLRI